VDDFISLVSLDLYLRLRRLVASLRDNLAESHAVALICDLIDFRIIR